MLGRKKRQNFFFATDKPQSGMLTEFTVFEKRLGETFSKIVLLYMDHVGLFYYLH